jgi:hypothetical protein
VLPDVSGKRFLEPGQQEDSKDLFANARPAGLVEQFNSLFEMRRESSR